MVTRGGLDFYSLWQDSALGLSRVFFKNQKFEIKIITWGRFVLYNFSTRTAAWGFVHKNAVSNEGIAYFRAKTYVKSCNYTIITRNRQNEKTGRACVNSPGIVFYAVGYSVKGY